MAKAARGRMGAGPAPRVPRRSDHARPQWIHYIDASDEGTWTEAKRLPIVTEPAVPTGLVWGEGAIWVSLQVGAAFDSDDIFDPIFHSVLLTTRPGTAPVITLPSRMKAELERYNRTQEGNEDLNCGEVAFLFGPPPPPPKQAERVDAIMAMEPVGEASVAMEVVYVGELDGSEVLTGVTHAWDPKSALAFARQIEPRTGLGATAQCRIPSLIRMLRSR